jgi:hypothetical protein
MATSINSNLAGKIIASSAMEAFGDLLTPLNGLTTSFDSEATQVGTSINIPYMSQFANSGTQLTASFVDGTTKYSAVQNAALGEVTLTIDQHKYLSWKIYDHQTTQFSLMQLETFGRQKGADMARTIFNDIIGKVTYATYGDGEVVAASAFGIDNLLNIRETMVDAGGDISQCSLILNAEYYANLMADSRFVANTYGGTDVIRGGKIGSVVGIPNVYEVNQLPNSSENLVGFLVHPASIAVAFRYLAPMNSGAYSRAERLTNELGMTMGYRQFYLPEEGTEYATIESLYGSVVCNTDAIIPLRSATAA